MQANEVHIEMTGSKPNNPMETTVENLQVSKAAATEEAEHEEKHIQAGEYLKSAVYGGMDGLINTLSVVVGGVGSNTDPFHIMAVGMSVLIGDGIGMALGDYLSSKSEREYIKAEEAREMWEVDNKIEDEKKEMEELYIEKGYGQQESKRLADLISHNKQAFVNIMMLEELGLAVDDSSPAINGVVTFFSFVIFGLFPLLPYIIDRATHSDPQALLIGSLATGAFLLFSLGFAKAILLGTNKLLSGGLTLLLGSAAVAVGYGIGVGLRIE